MYKRIISLILICSVLLIGATACADDNKGYKEELDSMGNNPVQVVPWLKRIKKSLYKKKAHISLYELDGRRYYVVQSVALEDAIEVSPYTVYEKNDEKAIIYFHADNVLDSDSEQDEEYIYFIENAALIDVLWSNEKR